VLGWKGVVTARQQVAAATRDLTDRDTRAKLDELRRVSTAILVTGLGRLQPAGPRPPEAASDPRVLAARRDGLERELAGRNPAFRAARKRPTPAEVRAALPPGVSLVDFLEYEHYTPPARPGGRDRVEVRLVAFVLRPDNDVVRVDLGPAARIGDAVRRWRSRYGVSTPPAVDGKPEPGAELRVLVWDKLAPHLGGAKVILVSPDGPLTGLPFAALPGEKPGTFLVEDGYAFATIPVPQLLPPLLAP